MISQAAQRLLCCLMVVTTVSCSDVAVEAQKAKDDGRLINNEVMTSMYPGSFVPGDPQYLERDFEAGADFICDEIKKKRGEDVCASSDINWR